MADRISNLPDVILCHILSFLQTKQSVATSILSKRWNHLWLSVLTLCFNTDVHFQTECFELHDFIDRALRARDATLPVKSFHFNVGYGSRLQNPIVSVTKWVNFVVQRRVEYLYLHLNAGSYPELPVTILTCKTLVVLKLFQFCVEEGYSSVVLPSLKTLHLKYIWFPKLQDFIMFLSGCSILEELHTFHVTYGSDESLTCIEWSSFCLRNLTRADIRCTHSYFPLKAVSNTPSLCLELNQAHYRDDLIPTFHNLTQLELISLRYSCKFLVKLLNHCPNLQKLGLRKATSDKKSERQEYRENWVDPDVVPQCLSLHLKTCNLFNFYGLRDELMLASYILKSASILETMKIWYSGHCRKKSILSSIPRASSTCKLTYG